MYVKDNKPHSTDFFVSFMDSSIAVIQLFIISMQNLAKAYVYYSKELLVWTVININYHAFKNNYQCRAELKRWIFRSQQERMYRK